MRLVHSRTSSWSNYSRTSYSSKQISQVLWGSQGHSFALEAGNQEDRDGERRGEQDRGHKNCGKGSYTIKTKVVRRNSLDSGGFSPRTVVEDGETVYESVTSLSSTGPRHRGVRTLVTRGQEWRTETQESEEGRGQHSQLDRPRRRWEPTTKVWYTQRIQYFRKEVVHDYWRTRCPHCERLQSK